MVMIETLAFALVAVALGFPALIVAMFELAPPEKVDRQHDPRRSPPRDRPPRPAMA